jgi:hypothetical protein
MELNYTALFAAAIAHFILGWIWHHPKVLGTLWMQLSGVKEKECNKNDLPRNLIITFISSLITAGVFQYLFHLTNTSTLEEAIKLASIIWFGFNASILVGMVLWDNKKLGFYGLTISYWLASFLLIGAITISI